MASDDFEAFYLAHYGRLVGQLLTMLGDLPEAEDAVQEAFARASVRWRWLSAYDAPDAWVRRVAFNVARNSLRRARSRLRAAQRLPRPAEAPAPSAELLDVLAAMRPLPLRLREALVLHYVTGLPVEEVARQLRVPAGTVKSRLARGRAALARRLGAAEGEEARRA
jgi:RNA polymerase sigma-70 factor (ECF subfamily)